MKRFTGKEKMVELSVSKCIISDGGWSKFGHTVTSTLI